MTKFPQLDWVAINGRDTPFTKPQHYKEGSTSETDLTGHDNPLPTTDKSVRAELESIKATQDKILKRLDEPLDTQVTGSNVEKKVLVERSIYNKNTPNVGFRPPEGSKSMKLELTVHGATGSFESEQGASIYLLSRTDSGGSYGFVQSEKVSSARGTVIDWGKGIDYQDTKYGDSVLVRLTTVNSILPTTSVVRIAINGNFEEGEGVDCELMIKYFF